MSSPTCGDSVNGDIVMSRAQAAAGDDHVVCLDLFFERCSVHAEAREGGAVSVYVTL